MPAYEIVPYRPEYEQAVARLHAHHSTPDPAVNAAYLAWKYDRNPYLEKRHLYLALHQGEVVAMRGFYGACWEAGAGGRCSHIVPCAADLVIVPGHRDRGLFTRIMQEADREIAAGGFPFVFSLTPSPVTAMGLLTLGWQAVGTIGVMQRETGFRLLRRKVRRRLKKGFSTYARRRASRQTIPNPRGTEEDQYSLRKARLFGRFDERASRVGLSRGIRVECAPRVAAMVRLIDRVASGGFLRHRRDETYLAWRYLNPLSEYRFLYRGDEPLEGYLVLHAPRYGRGFVSLVDWEATSAHAKLELLKETLALGDFDSVRAWSLGTDEASLGILASLGFEAEAGEGVARLADTVLVKALTAAQDQPWMFGDCLVTNPTNWQFRMIYSDFC